MPEAWLSNQLREHRQRRGWSQAELAQRAGISRAEVSAIETGRLRAPSTGAALALAAALGVRVEDLFSLGRAAAQPVWAWEPRPGLERHWQVRIGERELRIPVEQTLLGAIPHDGSAERAAGPTGDRTVVLAGCDPAVGLLAAEVGRQAGVRVLALTRSSGRALELLAAGQVHLAGVHLGDNALEVRRALGKRHVLARVAEWEAGLAVDPLSKVRSVRAAIRSRLRWVGREEGSGARRSLDRVVAAEAGRSRPNLDHVASDHVGVAETIRSGWAQLGPCLRLTAEQAGLDFLSIERQAYDLCTTQALRRDPAVQAVLEALRSASLRQQLGELPGYDASETGSIVAVA